MIEYFIIGLIIGVIISRLFFGAQSDVIIKEPFKNQDTLFVDDRGICYRYQKVYD